MGKAIAAVITLAAKGYSNKTTRNNLEKIAAQAKNNWVKIAQQELTQQSYPQLREVNLDRFLTPEELQLTQEGNLGTEDWESIFRRLNMAACKGGGFKLPSEVYSEVAELLHTTFPKALRETLKEDFASDGKAFAGLTLQLLTGMKAELGELRNSNAGINVAELSQILEQFQQLETQLRGTVAQQQALFQQLSQEIDSGFAEVCQQLGVMETNITRLLQNLERRLDDLDEKLTRLEAQGGRQLSKRELRNRQKLLAEMRTEAESRLSQSIHRAAFVNLGKEQQPQQVQRPWDISVKVGEQRSIQLPPQTTILDVFDNPTISGKFLILGKPGGGKTTTLLELAEALIARAEGDSNAPIPVILELSSWQEVTKREFPKVWEQKKYDPSIKEWVLSQLMSKGVSQEIGEQWLRDKELVLLLDGLDELQPERQEKCVRAINQFLGGEFSPLHLVVYSRKEEYEEYKAHEMLHLNGAICLEDLTNEQIRDYFASVNLGEFWKSIKDFEKIIDFIRQPLFLAITSIAYQQIDIEEWRNCNTEERAVDYLLNVYRLEIFKIQSNTQYDIPALKTQEIIALLAKYLGKNEDLVTYLISPYIFELSQNKTIEKTWFFVSYCGWIPCFLLIIYSALSSDNSQPFVNFYGFINVIKSIFSFINYILPVLLLMVMLSILYVPIYMVLFAPLVATSPYEVFSNKYKTKHNPITSGINDFINYFFKNTKEAIAAIFFILLLISFISLIAGGNLLLFAMISLVFLGILPIAWFHFSAFLFFEKVPYPSRLFLTSCCTVLFSLVYLIVYYPVVYLIFTGNLIQPMDIVFFHQNIIFIAVYLGIMALLNQGMN